MTRLRIMQHAAPWSRRSFLAGSAFLVAPPVLHGAAVSAATAADLPMNGLFYGIDAPCDGSAELSLQIPASGRRPIPR